MDMHYVVEKHFWALDIDYMQKDTEKKVLTPDYMAVLDTTTPFVHGPKAIISPLIAGITVAEDCSNVSTLPTIRFSIDGASYTLHGDDYVKRANGKCMMGIVATDATDKYIHLGSPFIIKHSPVNFNYGQGYVQFTRPASEAEEVEQFIQ